VVVLALIGSVAFMLQNAAQEKAKLQAELQKAQKKIAQQAVVVKQVTAAKQAAALEISPAQAARPAPTMVGAANSETKPGVNAGDCLVTSKESVAASLKGCIDSFNSSRAGARSTERRP
jgi:DNA anti-recombination protein RmuC